jgi:putative transposase
MAEQVRPVADSTRRIHGTSIVRTSDWASASIFHQGPRTALPQTEAGGEVKNVSVLVAIGVGADGYRQILASLRARRKIWKAGEASYGTSRSAGSKIRASSSAMRAVAWWKRLTRCSLRPIGKAASCTGIETCSARCPTARSPRSRGCSRRSTLRRSSIGRGQVTRGRHETADHEAAQSGRARREQSHGNHDLLRLPEQHWRQLRTNNPLEWIIREIRRRTRVVGAFPDGHSALMLVAARLRHIASTKWGRRRYLAMESLLNPMREEVAA